MPRNNEQTCIYLLSPAKAGTPKGVKMINVIDSKNGYERGEIFEVEDGEKYVIATFAIDSDGVEITPEIESYVLISIDDMDELCYIADGYKKRG